MIDRVDSKSRKRVLLWPVALLRVYIPARKIAGLDDGHSDQVPLPR